MDAAVIEQRIQELVRLLDRYAYQYYDLDNPEISDAAYDELVLELEKLEKLHPQLISKQSTTQKVGGTASASFEKVVHTVKMESLQNAFSKEDIHSFLERVLQDSPAEMFVVEPKIDGLSVSLEYQNGIFVRGSTRGDGLVGEDITENLRTLKEIPHKIDTDLAFLEVRGEVYLSKKNFFSLVEQQRLHGEAVFKNPRNAAAGSLRQKHSEVTRARNLSIFLFNVQQISAPLDSHKESLNLLTSFGLPVAPSCKLCGSFQEVWDEIERIDKERSSLAYDIDGAVVKVDDLLLRVRMGSTSKFPRWAVAFKYPPEIKSTVLCDVEVQVGRTGVLTPTAVFQPVVLSGTTVSRAVLHNQDFIDALDVRIGDTVDIHKTGDVIPEVLRSYNHLPNSRTFQLPDHCPICKEPTSRLAEEVAVRCVNPNCPEQLRRNLIHFASRDAMDIDGMGPATIDQLLEKGLVNNAADIFDLTAEDLFELDNFKERSANKLLTAVSQCKERNLDRLIFAMGIPNVGRRTATLLCQRFCSMNGLLAAETEEISEIFSLGQNIAQSVTEYLSNDRVRELIARLQRLGVNMEYHAFNASNVLSGKSFVFTGALDRLSRDEARELVEKNGGRVSGSVSQKTDYVVTGENTGSKLTKARQLGIRILSEAEFLSMLHND